MKSLRKMSEKLIVWLKQDEDQWSGSNYIQSGWGKKMLTALQILSATKAILHAPQEKMWTEIM